MSDYLSKVKSPADVKRLSIPQLTRLAEEIRERLIIGVSKTGGHIGPNLGVVELTLAMHFVFDTPRDSFSWVRSFAFFAKAVAFNYINL